MVSHKETFETLFSERDTEISRLCILATQVQFDVEIREVVEKREEPCLAAIKDEAEVAAAMERRETNSTGKIRWVLSS